MINIEGLNKAEVLRDLYNASKVQGLGFLQATGVPMATTEAEELLTQTTYFDYLHGKVMKINLVSDVEFDEWGYDRDNGPGSAKRVIDILRQTTEAVQVLQQNRMAASGCEAQFLDN